MQGLIFLEIQTKPGMIRLASISVLVRNTDAILLSLDCNSKYYTYTLALSETQIILGLTCQDNEDQTLRMSKRKNPTEIIITRPFKNCLVMIDPPEIARYGLVIGLFRSQERINGFNLQNSRPERIEL